MCNYVQQDHGLQQDQQGQQDQQHPKGKIRSQKKKNQVKFLDLIPSFNRFKISRKGPYSLSTVTSLARGANSSGGTRSTRGSWGSSHTRLTTVSLQEEGTSSETMFGR